jgi:cell division protein FtsZ
MKNHGALSISVAIEALALIVVSNKEQKELLKQSVTKREIAMSLTITPAPQPSQTLSPTITVVGVGGAGGNAVNNMIAAQLEGVSFVVANTDAQALTNAQTKNTIQLGANITQGLGAGANPDVGSAAAEEAAAEIMEHVEGSHMVFITAGMGGGTGTGAAPVVARMAKEQGILTVAVVTKPFHFEGTHRMKLAESGLEELQRYVDTMIVIPNQNLFRIANEKTTFADAFRMADEVLHSGVRGVTDLMVMPGLINLDFADIRTVMREMGKAMMGTGEAEGERRAVDAAEAAISNPLLDDVSMKGARGVLINITGGHDMTLFEVDEAANRIRDEVDTDANIIFGSTFHDNMEGRMRVSVVATGIDQVSNKHGRHSSGSSAQSEGSRSAPSYSLRNGVTTAVSNAVNKVRPMTEEKPVPSAPTKAETISVAKPITSAALKIAPAPIAQPQPLMRSSEPVRVAQEPAAAPQPQDMFQFPQEQEEPQPQEVEPSIAEAQPQEYQGARGFGRHAPTRREIASQPMEEPTMRGIQGQAAVAQQETYVEEEYREDDDQPGLFQRMANRLTPREEEAQPAPIQQRRIEVAAHNPEPAGRQEDLDIPAFLRRQAN